MTLREYLASIGRKGGKTTGATKRRGGTVYYKRISALAASARRTKRLQRRRRVLELPVHEQRLKHLKAAHDRHVATSNHSKAFNMKASAEHVFADVAKIFDGDIAGLVKWCIAQPVNYSWLRYRLHSVGVHIPTRS
jgi:hypothetical protein